MTPWATLSGWFDDPERPGFLRNPEHPGCGRTPDGRWWNQADIDQARVVVDEVGAVVALELRSGADPELVRLVREGQL